MSREALKQKIVDRVNGRNGLKATELAAEVDLVMEANDESLGLPELFEELVCEEKIAEIEYTVPDLPTHIKSFYLPIGSRVTGIVNAKYLR